MKRLFIFTFCLLLFEIGYALDVPDFMMVPKSTWVAAFPELNKADIQTEISTAPQDANLGLRLVHLKKSYQATRRASEGMASSTRRNTGCSARRRSTKNSRDVMSHAR